ncbi:hypothetical protein IscW_ISCW007747 [Ixodes scapularis]|uniref:Uncharacterized protein n=1 Tax=Ixodes scapularis TaxID=6945 RepID=B7PRY3_IXOSC|nr:hypothetical protein IscW_ISCW007747 [Ixodes scapularis]|eukprot:XP_002401332.1 hypothetical protein IscW_ISCW007747 [Ixodes scapularis]
MSSQSFGGMSHTPDGALAGSTLTGLVPGREFGMLLGGETSAEWHGNDASCGWGSSSKGSTFTCTGVARLSYVDEAAFACGLLLETPAPKYRFLLRSDCLPLAVCSGQLDKL